MALSARLCGGGQFCAGRSQHSLLVSIDSGGDYNSAVGFRRASSFSILGCQEVDSSPTRVAAEIPASSDLSSGVHVSRRGLLSRVIGVAALVPLVVQERPVLAGSYREYTDRIDGYAFSYPEGWLQVRGAGADVFFRDPVNLDENVVVDISSPSSSHYRGVEDLGSPQEAGERVLKQYLTEFMSTRLGVRRESNLLSTNSKIGDDGRLYYEIEVNVKSFANTNELAVMPGDRVAKLEWNRRYLSVLGVENNRLYQLRLQTPERVLAQEESSLRQIMDSFRAVLKGIGS